MYRRILYGSISYERNALRTIFAKVTAVFVEILNGNVSRYNTFSTHTLI